MTDRDLKAPTKLIVGLSGASGAIYGVRLLEVLAPMPDVETHVVISGGARATIAFETDRTFEEVASHADVLYGEDAMGAAIASGTFVTQGMIVAPCSIKTLSAIANGFADSLIARAADVCLKERRRLVLVVRETPLHLGHLRLMTQATEAGAVILPPVPGFYTRPASICDLVDHTITKMLDLFAIESNLIKRWRGIP
jgi:4-hydroxy-3-polyprenylbenzoate decarboxylase